MGKKYRMYKILWCNGRPALWWVIALYSECEGIEFKHERAICSKSINGKFIYLAVETRKN